MSSPLPHARKSVHSSPAASPSRSGIRRSVSKVRIFIKQNPMKIIDFDVPRADKGCLKLAVIKNGRVFVCKNDENELRGDVPSVTIEITHSDVFHLTPNNSDEELLRQFKSCNALEQVSETSFRALPGADTPVGKICLSIEPILVELEVTQRSQPMRGRSNDLEPRKQQPNGSLAPTTERDRPADVPAADPAPLPPSRTASTLLQDTSKETPRNEEEHTSQIVKCPSSHERVEVSLKSPVQSRRDSGAGAASNQPARNLEADADALFGAAEVAGQDTQETANLEKSLEVEQANESAGVQRPPTDVGNASVADEQSDADEDRPSSCNNEENGDTIVVDTDLEGLKKRLKPVEVSPPPKRKRKPARPRVEGPHLSRRSLRDSAETEGPLTKVFFASSTDVDADQSNLQRLRQLGVTKTETIEDCDVFCVGQGRLIRSINLIMAILGGKAVVNDHWLWASIRVGKLHNYADYLAKDPPREKTWGFRVVEAVERSRGRLKALRECRVAVTEGLRQKLGGAYEDLRKVALAAGAVSVDVVSEEEPLGDPEDGVLVVGDEDEAYTEDLIRSKWRCYTKDMVILSALRGRVDFESGEFLLQSKTQERAAKRRKISS